MWMPNSALTRFWISSSEAPAANQPATCCFCSAVSMDAPYSNWW